MKDNKQLVGNILEALGLTLFMISFGLIGIGGFSIILMLFPLLFIVYGVKNNIIPSILLMVIVSMVISIFTDTLSGVLLFLTFAPITASTIYGMKIRRKPLEILTFSSIIFFVTFLLQVIFLRNITGMNIVHQLENTFETVISGQIDILRDMGLSNYEIIKIKDLLINSYKTTLLLIPSILIIATLIISYLNYFISVLVLRKIGIGIVYIPRFSKFRLPNNIIPGIIIMLLGAYLTRFINGFNYQIILANLTLLIWFLLYAQGLSLTDALMIRRKVKMPLRLILLLFLIFFTPLMPVITIIGLLDVLLDFRKRDQEKS